jgi:hypothetical protein
MLLPVAKQRSSVSHLPTAVALAKRELSVTTQAVEKANENRQP